MQNQPKDQTDTGFGCLGLNSRLLTVLTNLGHNEPTPIQREAIPAVLEGRDLVGQAATGTGKTAAFALPLIHKIAEKSQRSPLPQALILVPTRELANQVAQAVQRYGASSNIRVLAIYGGQSYDTQIRTLKRGVDIVVATPGRAIDHLQRGTLKLDNVQALVLDEADEMLDLGFLDDIESIIESVPSERQMMLFSATMAPRIAAIAKRHLNDPVRITIAREKPAAGTAPRVRQNVFVAPRPRKLEALLSLLELEEPSSAIIFCRTRQDVDMLSETLSGNGFRAEALHGGMTQSQRERVLQKLRAEQAELVVATDVAARGLDIDHLSHVFNFDVPSSPETYVHRIGRVGRAGREGTAITIAEPRDHRLFMNIERVTKQKVPVSKLPTAADLKAKRLEQTRSSLQSALQASDLDVYLNLVEGLAEGTDLMQVALAAVKLVHATNEPQRQMIVANQSAERPQGRPDYHDRQGAFAGSGTRGDRRERVDFNGQFDRRRHEARARG